MASVADDVVQKALTEYPMLKNLGMSFAVNPKKDAGFLEFWPADETGTKDYPRPASIPFGKTGVEIYDLNTRPIDIAGDITSHHLVKTDPRFMKIYEQFEHSLTPRQHARLKQQYQWARENEGEERPYEQWYGTSGLPGYFRGHTFQQWDDPDGILYTHDQRALLNQVIPLLKGQK